MDIKKASRTLLCFVFIILCMAAIEFLFYSGTAAKQISYSQFLNRVVTNQVQSLLMSESKIYGLMKTAGKNQTRKNGSQAKPKESKPGNHFAFASALKRTPWHLDVSILATKLQSLEDTQTALKPEPMPAEIRYFRVNVIENQGLINLLRQHKVRFSAYTEALWIKNFTLNWFVPFSIIVLFWVLQSRKIKYSPKALRLGSNYKSIQQVNPEKLTGFKQIAGMGSAIEESREIVAFLKAPHQLTRLGANLPKGVLFAGAPGAGKSLLARAIAGESEVPMFSLDAIELVKLFNGATAPTINGLFKSAKKKAPCVIFINRLDEMAMQATDHDSNGYPFDQTMNISHQLLTGMENMDGQAGIIFIGATCHPERIDPTWLQPGRFDRQILIRKPVKEDRESIFELNSRQLILDQEIDFSSLAANTAGMGGADIANLCNEAALLAARCNRNKVTQADFQEALEKRMANIANKAHIFSQEERTRAAYCEAGRILVNHFTPEIDPIKKASIFPDPIIEFGNPEPATDRVSAVKSRLLAKVRNFLATRAAEEIVFGEASTQSSDKLGQANQLIRIMLTEYGMSQQIPYWSLKRQNDSSTVGDPGHHSELSVGIESQLDSEQQEILKKCYSEAISVINRHRSKLDKLANYLLENEQIAGAELHIILGPRPTLQLETTDGTTQTRSSRSLTN